jgi:hypothetical protein
VRVGHDALGLQALLVVLRRDGKAIDVVLADARAENRALEGRLLAVLFEDERDRRGALLVARVGRRAEDTAAGKGASPPVDASGVLPDGRSFAGPDEFKRLLAADPDRFAEALVEKLATFALRRAMTIDDRTAIREIAAAAKADSYRLRSLVEAVATSDLIRRR